MSSLLRKEVGSIKNKEYKLHERIKEKESSSLFTLFKSSDWPRDFSRDFYSTQSQLEYSKGLMKLSYPSTGEINCDTFGRLVLI